MKQPERLVIATRKSPLAYTQAQFVGRWFEQHYPAIAVHYLPLSTKADRFIDRALKTMGGKGLFVKELEEALLRQEADIAVHSLKDMPCILAEPFENIAYLKRHAWQDMVIKRADLSHDMPLCIGTSSLRRAMQLKKLYPDARFKPIRGNLQTRLAQLENGDYDALCLALAGLQRLDLPWRDHRILEIDEMIPSAGQGILAVEALRDSPWKNYFQGLQDAHAQRCAEIERGLIAHLGGHCQAPIAAFAAMHAQSMHVYLAVFGIDQTLSYQEVWSDTDRDTARIQSLAQRCLADGAEALIERMQAYDISDL